MKKTYTSLLILLVILISGCNPKTQQIDPVENVEDQIAPAVEATLQSIVLPSPTPTLEPEIRLEQSEFTLFIGDYSKALQEFETALKDAHNAETQAAAMTGMGRAHFMAGNYSGAIQSLLTVVENFEGIVDISDAYFFLGQSYANMQNLERSIWAYESYIARNPNSPIMAYLQELLGDTYAENHEYTKAIAAYEIAKASPQLSDVLPIDIKIGNMYTALGDDTNAIRIYMGVYEQTTNDYIKAQMDLLAGRAYVNLDYPEQAYARYLDAALNYPKAYDSYSSMIALLNAGIDVDDFAQAKVYYYARQYGESINAINRYVTANPTNYDGSALHFQALCLREMGDLQGAIAAWNTLITNFPDNKFFADAWDEIAYTQWVYLEKYTQAAETYLDFVAKYPDNPRAPDFLYEAGRIFERAEKFSESAATWERMINEFPTGNLSYRGTFNAAITYFRIGDYERSRTTFQRLLVLGDTPEDQAAAYYWIGKTYEAQGDQENAIALWVQASQKDPTGYYSERARERLIGNNPLEGSGNYQLDVDLDYEKELAQTWIRGNFGIDSTIDLNTLGALASDPRVIRGNAFWHLGLYTEAHIEYESLREAVKDDPISNFRLLDQLLKLGFYRSAIFTSRQILDLAGLDDQATLSAPDYFNHIRFGTFFKEFVLESAQVENLDPLLIFSVIRQESLFEGFIQSEAGARGLMQIMPATGQEMADRLGWPIPYTSESLYLPAVSIQLGTHYLFLQNNFFDGDKYAMLAAYNAGPGNALIWKDMAGADPDLFLELIRYEETRRYIMQISEFMHIYERIYENAPG
jgi:soluble lytic murein transglycosylase